VDINVLCCALIKANQLATPDQSAASLVAKVLAGSKKPTHIRQFAEIESNEIILLSLDKSELVSVLGSPGALKAKVIEYSSWEQYNRNLDKCAERQAFAELHYQISKDELAIKPLWSVVCNRISSRDI